MQPQREHANSQKSESTPEPVLTTTPDLLRVAMCKGKLRSKNICLCLYYMSLVSYHLCL